MSYKANIDILLAINALHIDMFRKQGLLRFKIGISYYKHNEQSSKKDKSINVCQPYNIYKAIQNKKQQNNKGQSSQSFIDDNEQVYYSRVMPSVHQNQMYCDVASLQKIQLQLRTQLLICPQGQKEFIQAGIFKAKIYKTNAFIAYMPIVFDQFGSFAISSFYQPVILQYKFQNIQGKTFNSFLQFVDAATYGLDLEHFISFYNYYRKSLQNQLQFLQQKHYQIIKFLNLQTNFQFIKPVPNPGIQHVINCLQLKSQPKARMLSIACDQVYKQNVGLKALIYQKLSQYVTFISELISPITQYHRKNYQNLLRQRLRMHVFSHRIDPRWDYTQSRYQDSGKQLITQAKHDKLKQKDEQLWRDIFPIQPISFFVEQNKAVKIFQQIYTVNGYCQRASRRSSIDIQSMASLQETRGPFSPRLINTQNNFNIFNQIRKTNQKSNHAEHIVILVHGYQASRQDFILFKRCLHMKYGCRVFVSGINQGRTQDSISFLGKRLSQQIIGFLRGVQLTATTKISFVGHSMGGVIIRAALPHLRNIYMHLHSYMSFSSPHLGYLYQPSALIQAGLWLLNAWQKTPSLQQLCMRDSEDLRNSVLFKLSQNNSFKFFKNIALVSSSQDEYVPYQSARIEKNNKLLQNISCSKIILQMVDNLLGQLTCNEISRISVVFDIQQKTFDSLIGRTAHIKYISDHKFINMLTLIFDKYFA